MADELTVETVTLNAGETKQVAIGLNNPTHQYAAFQFDLVLPEGVSIAKNEKGKFIASLNEDRKDDHTLTVSEMGNNTYRFLTFSMTNAEFYGKDGALVYVNLKAGDGISGGSKTATIQSQVFTEVSGTQHKWEDTSFTVEIKGGGSGQPDTPVTGDDMLTVEAISMKAGDTKQMTIGLNNPTHQYAAFQFDLVLPEGVSIAKNDKGKFIASLNEYRKNDHTLTVSDMGNNTYRFLTFSMTNAEFYGTSGALVKVTLQAADGIGSGNKTATIKSQVFTEVGGEQAKWSDLNFTITVPEEVTVTITPPTAKTGLVYNGSAQELVSAGSTNIGTLQYSLDGSSYSTAIPKGTDAKTYTVYYKAVDGNKDLTTSATLTVTISPKTVSSPTITLSETSFVYNGQEKKPTVTVKDGKTTIPTSEYTVSYSNNINAGTATATVKDKDGGNYVVNGSAQFTITKASASVTAPKAKSGLVYNGKAQELITAGSSADGTLQYSQDGSNYSTAIPKGTDAKTYTVYYRVKGDANHSDIAPATLTVTITPKTVNSPTITLSETSYVYDGKEKKPTVTVKDGNTTIPTSEYAVSYSNNVNVGTATVTITDVNGGNYVISGSAQFTITSAAVNVTAPKAKTGLVYNGSAQELITAGSSDAGEMQYSLDGSNYSTAIPKGTDAKTYTVYYRVKGDANHGDVAPTMLTATISPKTVSSPTITLSETSFVYNGQERKPTVTVKDGNTIIPTSEYTVSYSNNINAGTATATVKDKDGGNYVVNGSAQFTITKTSASLTAPKAKSGLVYNGKAQELITAGSSADGTLQYSQDGSNYSTDIPKGTDAKTYTVYYRVNGDANHNDIAPATLTATISPKTVSSPTITLSETSYVYDGKEKKPTVTVKDGNTTIPTSEYTVSYSNNINAGTAIVNITDKDGGNYVVNGSAQFTITKASASGTAPKAKSGLIYIGSAQELITAGSSSDGTLQYSLDGSNYGTAIPKGTDAKTYTVYYKLKGDANHNDTEPTMLKVTISPKTVSSPTITLSQTSYVYDGKEKKPTVTVKDGNTTIPTSEYTVIYSNNVNVGTATVTITDKDGGNYVVNGSVSFAITDGTASYTAPKAISGMVYIGRTQELITAGSSTDGTLQYSLDGSNYSTAIPTGKNAKTYTIYYKVKGDANHNDTKPATLTATISPAPLKRKAGDYCKLEGEDNPEFTLTYEGFVNNETEAVLTKKPTVSCQATKDSPAGEYEVVVRGAEAQNYNISYQSGWLIIEAIDGINDVIMDGKPFDVYNTQGRKIRSGVTSLKGLPKGVYIINGKKIIH